MTCKEIILKKFLENQNSILNGESLALECGVSRAYVWKSINALRTEGYKIKGTTNGGYILEGLQDICSVQLVRKFLAEEYPDLENSHIECFKSIDSTNSYAKRLLAESGNLRDEKNNLTEKGKLLNESIFIAESQSAGRGRSGRTFISPERTGIYLSVVYLPEGGVKEPGQFTAFSAVAVCRVLKRLYGIDARIKWINDIFYNGKKICGILTEGVSNFESGLIEACVVGIGINIEENEVLSCKAANGIAGAIVGKNEENKVSRAQLAAEVAGEVIRIFKNKENVIDEYKNLSFIIGKEVEVHSLIDSASGIYMAKVLDITKEAGLHVMLKDGSEKLLNSGEVSLKSYNFLCSNN